MPLHWPWQTYAVVWPMWTLRGGRAMRVERESACRSFHPIPPQAQTLLTRDSAQCALMKVPQIALMGA
jgi:hypothetical protein